MSTAFAFVHRARLASVLALGAFGVHQLRYLLANGGESSQALAGEGHGYLAGVLPLLAGLALAALLATLLGARLGAGRDRRSLVRRTLAHALALLAVYSVQELFEGALAAGHPAGLDALVANAGWIAAPLALAFGVAAALIIRGLEEIESALATLFDADRRPIAPRVAGSPRSTRCLSPLRSPLAFGLARRPPPAVA